jgi:hypothetical protein
MNWTSYHRLADIYGYMSYLAATYPSLVSLINIGSSYEKNHSTFFGFLTVLLLVRNLQFGLTDIVTLFSWDLYTCWYIAQMLLLSLLLIFMNSCPRMDFTSSGNLHYPTVSWSAGKCKNVFWCWLVHNARHESWWYTYF